MSTPAQTELKDIDYLKNGIKIIKSLNHDEIRAWLEEEQSNNKLFIIENNTNPFKNPSFKKLSSTEKADLKRRLTAYKEARNIYLSDNRAYIPQGHLGICPAGSNHILSIRLLSTHGIGPCVGFTMYSKNKGLAILAHIDDEFKATAWDLKGDTKIKAQNEAEEHYVSYINEIMKIIGNPEDISVNLIYTLDNASPQLKNIIKNACLRSHISKQSINDNVFEPRYNTDSCVLFLNDGKVVRYEEQKKFESGQSILDTLKLPEELRLFYLERGHLKELKTTADYTLLPSGYITHDPSDFIEDSEIKVYQENIQTEDRKKDEEAEDMANKSPITENDPSSLVGTLSDAETALNLPTQDEIKLRALMHGITARSQPDVSSSSQASGSTRPSNSRQENEKKSTASNTNASAQSPAQETNSRSQELQDRLGMVNQNADELKHTGEDVKIANESQEARSSQQSQSSSNRSLASNQNARRRSTEKNYEKPTISSEAKKRDKFESNEPKPPWKPPGPGKYKP